MGMRGYGGLPGPRLHETRQSNEATELWLSVKTAIVGSITLEAIVTLAIFTGLFFRRGILPILGFASGFIVFAVIRMVYWQQIPLRVALHIRTLTCFFGSLIGLAYMDRAWGWFEVGIVAANGLVGDFLNPFKWFVFVLLGILITYAFYQDMKGSLWLTLLVAITWLYAYYNVFYPGTWKGGEHWALVWSRIRIFSIPYLLPPNVFALALAARMFVETAAGNALPPQVMPIQYKGVGNLLFPAMFPALEPGEGDTGDGEDDEEDEEEISVQSYLLRQPNGKQDVSLDIMESYRREDGLESWMRDVLQGRATISEEGSRTAGGVRGMKHYGFLRRQWKGWEQKGVWQPGQLERLKKAGLVEERTDGKGHILTEAGECFFVERVVDQFGVGSIPEEYQGYLDEEEA